ncbi:hypothetical protein DIJ64_08890 [Mycobacterium leprae]|uniref:Uncharacterized protein n=2 Tax=Mycobacterium leprae TaxID=1769 RepID=A0AAD0KVP9_MYCLR|nr:hypothetical protein DIJ64_08890 [Mycobacterium leprae]
MYMLVGGTTAAADSLSAGMGVLNRWRTGEQVKSGGSQRALISGLVGVDTQLTPRERRRRPC